MAIERTQRRPGDVILDHYMPNASEADREAARENLRAFAAAILRICTRIADERNATAIRTQEADEVLFKGESSAPP